MLQLQDTSLDFGPVRAVRSVSLDLPAGETVALIGPSGSGKSSLLRLVMGLATPDSGAIVVLGQKLEPASLPELRLRMGYVIQEGGLFPHLTARENLGLQARWLGWRPGRVADRITELCALTRLPAGVLDRYPVQLSGGQRQRVSLMRALMLDPDLLLLDEPLGALDPMIRADLQQDLKEIFTELKKTVVLVTHDLAEAVFFADRLVLLHEGRLVQQGTFADLSLRPAEPFVTAFVEAHRCLPGTSPEVAG